MYESFVSAASACDDMFTLSPVNSTNGVYIPTCIREASDSEKLKMSISHGIVPFGKIEIHMGSYYSVPESYEYFVIRKGLHPLTKKPISETTMKKIKNCFRLIDFHEPVMSSSDMTSQILTYIDGIKLSSDMRFLEAQLKIYSLNFYHENMTRYQCETLMKTKPIGSWLIRSSSVTSTKFMENESKLIPIELYFVLSIKSEHRVKHYLLKHVFGIGYTIDAFESDEIIFTPLNFFEKLAKDLFIKSSNVVMRSDL